MLVLFICALCNSVSAQLALPQTDSARSVSGQFVVHSVAASARVNKLPDLANNKNYLKLEPALTAVSCERIKHTLAATLGDKSQWHGRIYLLLHPAQSADDGATIIAEQFKDGWHYRLAVPDPIERTRFVRAIVQALLLEQANRNAGDHAAEVPIWLADGLAQHLLMSNESELLLPQPRWTGDGRSFNPTIVNARRRDPLATAHRTLREQPPLTIAELSWPTDEQLDGPAGGAYRSSAQLFVSELLRLPDGRACMRAMLGGLATCYNWQTAFLRAFRPHFERQADLEKWWALQIVHFTGRNPDQTWSPQDSWSKLDEILRTPVEVRRARNELPGRAEVSLATVIREWDFIHQNQTLRAKLRELDLVRIRVSQDLVALVDDYRRVLSVYVEKRNHAGLVLLGLKITSPNAKRIVRETIEQLAALEARRAELRPPPATAFSVSAETPKPLEP